MLNHHIPASAVACMLKVLPTEWKRNVEETECDLPFSGLTLIEVKKDCKKGIYPNTLIYDPVDKLFMATYILQAFLGMNIFRNKSSRR